MNRHVLTLAMAGALVLAMISGCARDENLGLPNTPPETYIAVDDSVRNETVYIQNLSWWGDDLDGEVIGFEYRWFQDPNEPSCPLDTDWVFTEENSHEFHLPVTQEMVRTYRIEVRAVDNKRAVDPSPSELTVPIGNSQPAVRILHARSLPDTTYPAMLIKWVAEDAEGRETFDSFKVWLDGNEENAKIVAGADSSASFGLDDFQGRYGERTVYLFGVDTGCDSSSIVSHTWYVQKPVGNVLIVDDLWSSSGAVDFTTNNTYTNLMNACVGEYSKLDLERYGGVTYTHNYQDLFKIYDLVIWYDDPVRAVSSTLPYAREAVGDYASGGGSFMLVSLTALGPQGAFSDEVMFEIFGVDTLHWRLNRDAVVDYNFDCKKSWNITGNAGLGLDSLKVTASTLGAKCMDKRESAVSLYHIRPFTVDGVQKTDYYLALLNQWGLGKVAVFAIPLSKCNGYGTLENEFCRAVDLMLD